MTEKGECLYACYLLINVFIVLNGRPLGVVTGGRRGRRQPTEQTAGVLLLPVYKLLHKALPLSHTGKQNTSVSRHNPLED